LQRLNGLGRLLGLALLQLVEQPLLRRQLAKRAEVLHNALVHIVFVERLKMVFQHPRRLVGFLLEHGHALAHHAGQLVVLGIHKHLRLPG
jgi:hypothetical protein